MNLRGCWWCICEPIVEFIRSFNTVKPAIVVPVSLVGGKRSHPIRSIRFEDRWRQSCSLQESNASSFAAVTFGVENTGPHVSAVVNGAIVRNARVDQRMLLTQRQVAELLPVLEHFVRTGSLPRACEPVTAKPPKAWTQRRNET